MLYPAEPDAYLQSCETRVQDILAWAQGGEAKLQQGEAELQQSEAGLPKK